MSTQNLPYIVIVNNPSGTPADTAEVSGADAVFKDGTGTEVYRFKTSKGIDSELKFGLIESAKTGTFTVSSVSAGDEFSFIISQDTDEVGGDGLIQVKASYVASAGDTVTDVASALKNVINANVQLKVTASNVAGVLTLTADTGYPLYTISIPSNALGSFTETTGTAVSPTGNSTTGELTTLTFAAPVAVSPGDTISASGFSSNNNDFVVQAVAGNDVVIFADSSEAPGGTAGDIILLAQDKRFDPGGRTQSAGGCFQLRPDSAHHLRRRCVRGDRRPAGPVRSGRAGRPGHPYHGHHLPRRPAGPPALLGRADRDAV